MSLDSTDFRTNATGGKQGDETNAQFVSQENILSSSRTVLNWSYLFAHHTKVKVIDNRLQTRFRTFIHKSIIHKRADKGVKLSIDFGEKLAKKQGRNYWWTEKSIEALRERIGKAGRPARRKDES